MRVENTCSHFRFCARTRVSHVGELLMDKHGQRTQVARNNAMTYSSSTHSSRRLLAIPCVFNSDGLLLDLSVLCYFAVKINYPGVF